MAITDTVVGITQSEGVVSSSNSIADFFVLTWQRFMEILTAPASTPEMLWIAIPLIITIFLMEFYFSRYAEEELGWNTTYGNSLVLVFVAIDLVRFVVTNDLLYFNLKTVVIGVIFIDGLLLTLLNFFHALPEKFAYGLSSKLPINFLAYMGIVFVYTPIVADYATAVAVFLFLIVIFFALKIVHLLIPKVTEVLKVPEAPKEEI